MKHRRDARTQTRRHSTKTLLTHASGAIRSPLYTMSFFDEPSGPRPHSPSHVFFGINPRTGTFEQHSAPRSLVKSWRYEVWRAAHDKLLQRRDERGASEAKYALVSSVLDRWVRSSLDKILLGSPTSLRGIKPSFFELLRCAPELLAIVERTRRSLSLFGPPYFEVSEFVERFTDVVRATVKKQRDARPNTRKRTRGADGPIEEMHMLLLLLSRSPPFATYNELTEFANRVVGKETATTVMRKTVMSLYQSRMDGLKRDVTEKKCVLSFRVGGVRLPLEVRDAIVRMAVLGKDTPRF